MKKFYSLSMALLMAALPAMAEQTLELRAPQSSLQTPVKAGLVKAAFTEANTQFKAPARADENLSMTLGYCGQVYGALSINDGQTGLAVMFPASSLKGMVGNQISAINVWAPLDQSVSTQQNQVNTIKECTVFITETLGGTPLCETKGTLGSAAFVENSIKLDTPYTIEAGKDVYVCVMYNDITTKDLVVMCDGLQPSNNYSGYLYSRFGNVNNQGQIVLQNDYAWKQFNSYVGNFNLTATVTGDNLPANQATIFADNREAVVKPGTKFTYLAGIYNEGANAINTVELVMKIGEQEPQTYTADVKNADGTSSPVGYHTQGLAYAMFTCDTEGNNIPYEVYVSKVNGEDNVFADNIYKGSLLCLSDGYPLNIVVEELTSTTCVACPVGITGMEQMKEKYGAEGRFIPIAVHCPIPTAGDPMNICQQGDVYYDFLVDISEHSDGLSAPSSYFMRRVDYSVYPSPDALEKEYQIWQNMLGMAEVKAAIEETDKATEVKLNLEITPAIDDKNEYGVCYTIVEDNVGPYVQSNGYTGSEFAYGWENKPAKVGMKFNDVARKGSVYKTLADSKITEFEAGVPVSYSTTVDLSAVKDLTQYSIVAMLINKQEGYVENACVVKSPTYTGINEVGTDNKTAIAYGTTGAIEMLTTGNIYSIDGRAAAVNAKGTVELPAGIYLVATPAGNAKVVVR